jgi:hypothetical protein
MTNSLKITYKLLTDKQEDIVKGKIRGITGAGRIETKTTEEQTIISISGISENIRELLEDAIINGDLNASPFHKKENNVFNETTADTRSFV